MFILEGESLCPSISRIPRFEAVEEATAPRLSLSLSLSGTQGKGRALPDGRVRC